MAHKRDFICWDTTATLNAWRTAALELEGITEAVMDAFIGQIVGNVRVEDEFRAGADPAAVDMSHRDTDARYISIRPEDWPAGLRAFTQRFAGVTFSADVERKDWQETINNGGVKP